jgi:hypothetical protein
MYGVSDGRVGSRYREEDSVDWIGDRLEQEWLIQHICFRIQFDRGDF